MLLRTKKYSYFGKVHAPAFVILILGFVLSGILAETLAWTGSYLAKEESPALLHPQLIPDLILGMGFYGGWAVSWLLLTRYFRFSLLQVFITAGLLGVMIEQNFQILKKIIEALSTNPLASLLMSSYVFVVYGSITGVGFILSGEKYLNKQKSNSWLKYPLAILLLFLFCFSGTYVIGIIGKFIGVIPTPGKIYERPFF